MSIPPQLIRVKRKRDDDSPVTFLQLDQGHKRHRSLSNWVYQRREVTATTSSANATAISRTDAKPVIHVSSPGDGIKRNYDEASISVEGSTGATSLEPRKFHVSRAMLSQASSSGAGSGAASWKQGKLGPTVFVERTRKKIIPKSSRQSLAVPTGQAARIAESNRTSQTSNDATEGVEQRRFRRPGVANRSRDTSRDASRDLPTSKPLPASLSNPHIEDMDRIVADMNQWVLTELGSNLQNMEQEKKKAEKPKFKPKAPEKRYSERHPLSLEPAPTLNEGADTPMADASEDEGNDDDWIIEEYVRIPAHSMALDTLPSDIGLLVLDGEKESMLFYGPPQDEDEDAEEDDEDENAENHYTADYPEDEVDSDDEFDRHAYTFRNANASDDEEYDDEEYRDESGDEMFMEGDDDDDDARMTRIQELMKRNSAR